MLEIPPEADRKPDVELRQRLKNEIRAITWSIYKARREAGEPNPDLQAYADHLGCSVGEIEAILDEEIGRGDGQPAPQRGPLKVEDPAGEQAALAEEWAALVQPGPSSLPGAGSSRSRVIRGHSDHRWRTSLIRLVLVHRVREVRAYYGYRRMSGDSSKSRRVGAARTWRTSASPRRGYPHMKCSAKACSSTCVQMSSSGGRQTRSTRRVRPSCRHGSPSHTCRAGSTRRQRATRGCVPLHTLSHLLIREMAFSAGYSTASLRERIYVGPASGGRTASGILVYTAEGDSEGTLGGLVQIGEPGRMRPVIESLLTHAQWCGQDPICRESTGQGMLSLNRAACHGCCLLPETSCVHVNVMLDRNAVVSLGATGTGLLGASA